MNKKSIPKELTDKLGMRELPPHLFKQHKILGSIVDYMRKEYDNPNEALDTILMILTYILASNIPDEESEIEYDLAFNKLINKLYKYKDIGANFIKARRILDNEDKASALADLIRETRK